MPKRAIGLDISDYSIEVIVLERAGGGLKVKAQNRVILKSGIVSRGKISDFKKLSQAVENVFKPLGREMRDFDNIIFGLPETQVYNHVFTAGAKDFKDLELAVIREIESIIPIKKEKIYYTYQVLNHSSAPAGEADTGQSKVFIAATDYQIFIEWKQFFKKINLRIQLFDIETLATFRGMFKSLPKKPVCVLDIGASTSQVAIFSKSGLAYAYTIPYAGEYFTKKIAQACKTTKAKAEELKIKYGLESAGRLQPAAQALRFCLKHLAAELKRNFDYAREKHALHLDELVLVGGSSNLRGIKDCFIGEKVAPRVSLGQPLFKLSDDKRLYIESIGLAVRGIDSSWSKTDPGFLLEKRHRIRTLQFGIFEKFFQLYRQFVKLLRTKRQTAFLYAVASLFILAGFYFWPLISQRRPTGSPLIIDQYPHSYSVAFQMPVIIGPAWQDEYIKGRFIEHTIVKPSEWTQALNISRQAISGQLAPGEKLWPAPVDRPLDIASLVFPLTLRWLAYNEFDLGKLFIDRMNKRQHQTEIAINQFRVQKFDASAQANAYVISGEVDFQSSILIDLSEAKIIVAIEDNFSLVEVKDIDTNLNVRAGPGVSFAVLTQIKHGNKYQLLEEKSDWVKIKLDNEEGWVSKFYINIINN